ncbi:hypothetical protein YC2023_011036 [Brassica napus]
MELPKPENLLMQSAELHPIKVWIYFEQVISKKKPFVTSPTCFMREESIRSEEGGGAYISKYIKGILKSRLSRREQSRWNIMDDTTSMAFFEEFSSLNPVFHTFLFYGRLPSPFSRVRNTSPHLSIHKKALPRGERKLQDEYALDSRIHSRPDPL